MRSGFVTLVGRPNVGKSTLINAMCGRKVSIVSDKPQTTRHRVMGVLSTDDAQPVFLDTPGLHKPQTALGAQLYFWARVAYVPAYAIGVPFLRTLVWAAALVGIVMVLVPLL